MIIVYESKTGFTKKYADMLAARIGVDAITVKKRSTLNKSEEIIFLGWMKAGKIQGLDKLRDYNIKAVCVSGTGRIAEPDAETVISRNRIHNIPFFYLRGGCYPLKELGGMDKIMLSMFVKMLKNRKDKSERVEEAIFIIENGFDGVKEENLLPVLEWINESTPA